jgi:hypothetical protein
MYIADPREGSNHSRGIAVDLTLADRQGQILDMGTPFDDMTTASHHGSVVVSREAQANRFMLLGLMRAAGFAHYAFEWWHFELPGELPSKPRGHLSTISTGQVHRAQAIRGRLSRALRLVRLFLVRVDRQLVHELVLDQEHEVCSPDIDEPELR